MNIWSGNLRRIRVTANKNRAILEPQAIFNEISASGFSFCSLLFLGIKKPQPLDFSKDCGAYFYYLALITRLLNDCSNPTRTYCSTTLTDSKVKTLLHSYRMDKFNCHFYIITRHTHICT